MQQYYTSGWDCCAPTSQLMILTNTGGIECYVSAGL